MNPENNFSSFGIEVLDLTGRYDDCEKRSGSRMPRKAYEKRKTRAAQVIAMREQAAAHAEVCAPQKNEKTSATFPISAVEVPRVFAWSRASSLCS